MQAGFGTQQKKECKTKYCIVEVIKKDGKSNEIGRGMYRGWKDKEAPKEGAEAKESTIGFLYISKTTRATESFNMDFYNILSIEVFDGVNKTFTFFMADEIDQAQAVKIMRDVHESLEPIADEKDKDFIDTEKYTDVPKDLGGTGVVTLPHNTRRTGSAAVGHGHGAGGHNRQNYYSDGSTYYSRKDPEPTFFKRKARKPTKIALAKMAAKIDEIAAGTYKQKLPKTKEDDEEEKAAQKNAKKSDAWDEEYAGYGQHFCC